MTMVVKNNMSAVSTLNTLNKNSSALQKSLAKVSSGMKINTAQDDASAYAISERMRVQIRSLDQANQNTQNDMAMMKTAEGAVQSTLEIVKTMKEKAINAANDSNTDEDRATIQKEINQYIDQVDDNALVTFNSKVLLDGSSMPIHTHDYNDKEKIIRGLNSAWIRDALDLIKSDYGISFDPDGASHRTLEVSFAGGDSGNNIPSGFENAIAWAGSSYNGKTLKLTINLDKVKDLDVKDQNGAFAGSGTQYLDRVISHEMTHAIMANKFQDYDNIRNNYVYVREGGTAEMTHGADERSSGFSAALNAIKGLDPDNLTVGQVNGAISDEYAGGFVVMRYFAKNASGEGSQDNMKAFMQALENGATIDGAVSIASKGNWDSMLSFEKALVKDLQDYSDMDAFMKEKCGIDTTNKDTGSVSGSDAGGKLTRTAESVVHEVGSTTNWSLPSSSSTVIRGLTVEWPDGFNTTGSGGGSLTFHTGAEANQSMNIGLYDMRARSIGLYDEEGQKLQVTTIAKANDAIGTLDKVVGNVIDEATNIGAVISRLEYTSSNLTTSSENVQAAESTIRDADMAKEMTNYTKNNVLLQAAQSMLAQANQNSSNVLSLLQ